MEFKSLGNIETSFRQIRLYAFVFAIVCVAVSGYALYASYSFAKEQREKIYVLDQGKSLMLALSQDASRNRPVEAREHVRIYVLDQGKSLMLALSQDASRNRPVEAREHVRRFHELFFTIAPDKDAIEKNMERAFVLCDKSAFNYYKDLAEKGYYNRAISGNVNQRIEVDSIHCNFNTYPYTVTTYARQFIVRQSNVTERSLVTTCTLQNSVRSDNNPQGFLMENFLVKENRDIQTYKR
ncbi:conjugative transposon protein TraK [Prevotella intermedia]|uniref:conjugative transposon protein TraK n=1 Tax=Prevotella intermedia TaxID=28131 RepID=UPI00077DF056|nr:conjugative transposon protein TraK [Prevotella intermedia]